MEVSEFFISSFIPLYSLNTLFIETNSSWLIYESINAVEIRISIVFNLFFPNSTILSCFFYIFLLIELYFLIPSVITQIFIPTEELVISTETATNKINAF